MGAAGHYANFLGVNLWGAILCWLGYIIPGVIAASRERSAGIEPTWTGYTDEEIAAREKARLEADPNLESVVAAAARQRAMEKGLEVYDYEK